MCSDVELSAYLTLTWNHISKHYQRQPSSLSTVLTEQSSPTPTERLFPNEHSPEATRVALSSMSGALPHIMLCLNIAKFLFAPACLVWNTAAPEYVARDLGKHASCLTVWLSVTYECKCSYKWQITLYPNKPLCNYGYSLHQMSRTWKFSI